VFQPTPSWTRTASTVSPSRPTRAQAQRRARSVSAARARIAVLVSVHVRLLHAGSSQRHSRLRHTSSTGRPAEAMSRTK